MWVLSGSWWTTDLLCIIYEILGGSIVWACLAEQSLHFVNLLHNLMPAELIVTCVFMCTCIYLPRETASLHFQPSVCCSSSGRHRAVARAYPAFTQWWWGSHKDLPCFSSSRRELDVSSSCERLSSSRLLHLCFFWERVDPVSPHPSQSCRRAATSEGHRSWHGFAA